MKKYNLIRSAANSLIASAHVLQSMCEINFEPNALPNVEKAWQNVFSSLQELIDAAFYAECDELKQNDKK